MSEKKQGVNPKEAVGFKKPPLHLVPPVAIIHMAMALKFGAYDANDGIGYGPFNWRDTDIYMSTYIGAINRHMSALQDGEDLARDSKQHHFSHIMACCAIALDSMELGNLVDDRPLPGKAADLIERLTVKPEVIENPGLPETLSQQEKDGYDSYQEKDADGEIPF